MAVIPFKTRERGNPIFVPKNPHYDPHEPLSEFKIYRFLVYGTAMHFEALILETGFRYHTMLIGLKWP
jgi:hypothetical protein